MFRTCSCCCCCCRCSYGFHVRCCHCCHCCVLHVQCCCCYCCRSSPSAAPNRMPPLSLLPAPLTDTSKLQLISAEPLTACQETLPESPSESCLSKGCVQAGKSRGCEGLKDTSLFLEADPLFFSPECLLFIFVFLLFSFRCSFFFCFVEFISP